jgi:hypothetical protein
MYLIQCCTKNSTMTRGAWGAFSTRATISSCAGGFRERERLGLLRRFLRLLRLLVLAVVVLGDDLLELLADRIEDVGAVLEALDDFLDEAFELREERARVVEVRRQPVADLAEGIEELPRRVRLLGEEVLVGERHLEHRELQPPDDALQRDRHLRVVEELVEEHGDDVERHRVDLAHRLADAAALELLQHVGHAGGRGEDGRKVDALGPGHAREVALAGYS